MSNYKKGNEWVRIMTGKKVLKLIIILVVVAIIGTAGGLYIAKNTRMKNIENKKQEWKSNAVVAPKKGSLQAAGSITITWKSASKLDKVDQYKVYVDNKMVAKTNGNITKCEYYTTSVSEHKVYIEADLKHGSKIYSDIVSFYVNKKGFCMNKDMAQTINADDWNVSWYYNWTVTKHNYTSFQKLQFVPMFWTSAPTDSGLAEDLKMLGYKYILAYNEPDREDQANMSVNTAIEGMKSLVGKGLKVGSPAAAIWSSISTDWFQPFMKKMKEEKMDVDFIALHHYWNWYTEDGAKAFLDIVDEAWKMYHKPIWITEFALSGVPNRTKQTRQSAIDYMKYVLPELDKREYVERYAWFSFKPSDYRNGGSAMLNTYTGEITGLGYEYQKLGVPEGYNTNKQLTKKNNKKDIVK